jgi:hypothetical protein
MIYSKRPLSWKIRLNLFDGIKLWKIKGLVVYYQSVSSSIINKIKSYYNLWLQGAKTMGMKLLYSLRIDSIKS